MIVKCNCSGQPTLHVVRIDVILCARKVRIGLAAALLFRLWHNRLHMCRGMQWVVPAPVQSLVDGTRQVLGGTCLSSTGGCATPNADGNLEDNEIVCSSSREERTQSSTYYCFSKAN